MSPDSIPQLSLGTAALIIFVVCAGFVMLRGMTRMIIGTVVLASARGSDFASGRKPRPSRSIGSENPSAWITTGLPIAAFLVSFFLIRKIAKAVARPFGKPRTRKRIPARIIGTRLPAACSPSSPPR